MSRVSSTALATATSSTDIGTTFRAALEAYKKQTKHDIASHSLAVQLQSCDSPSAILALLRTQVQAFDQSQSADENLTNWLDPTVNVLYAFSVTLGNGVGMVFPPANAIFAGIGVLLQAVKDVRASQNALVDLFGRIEYFFKRLETYIEVRPTVAMTDIIVKIMIEVLSILGIVTKEIGEGRMKKYLKKLVGRKDVEDALQRLDLLTREEARMAAAEVMRMTRGIDCKVEGVDERVQGVGMKVEGIDDKVQGVDRKVGSVIQGVKENNVSIQQVVNQVNDLNRIELRKDLRKWVTAPDPSVNFNAASSAHHEGTAAWCTTGNTLADWKKSGSLLWIHGKPGSGKSILSSVIIRDLKSMSNAGKTGLPRFVIIPSLQLSDQSDIFCDALSSLYSAHKGGSEQPTVDTLAECLKDMLMIKGQVPIYLVIDALDECPNDSGIPSSRERVLELVQQLVELYCPNLRLCITSRPEFDIRTTLELLATQQVSLHDDSGQKQDINDYVTFVVHSDRRMKRWRDNDKDAVIENLTEKADGMFRWVFCQLEVLRQCFPTNLRLILKELPKSLDETYKRILKDINNANRAHAYRLLQCLAVASRPLRVEELAEVLAFDLSTGGIPKLIPDWRWEDQEEAVLSACSSLVTVIIDAGSRIVQFSHFSVKEYLTSDRLASCMEEVARFHIPFEPSHVILAQACLGALLRLDDCTEGHSAEEIPLFLYADKHWVGHAQVGNVELQIKDALDYFLDVDKPHFSAWIRLHDLYGLWRRPLPRKRGSTPATPDPLYFAAERGLRGLVERLIVKHPQQVNHLGGPRGTPLHASVLGGYIEVARLLFAHSADINSRCAIKRTPLHIASEAGHLEIGRWLLNHGADVNPRDETGLTPLHLAASGGHLEVCRILLECSAKVNSRDDGGSTPFLFASAYGNPDIVHLFLDHNADGHLPDNSGNSPLHHAAENGQLEVARILLERNVAVDSQNDEGLTPLLLASDPHVIQLLLDHNADARLLSGDIYAPLHHAAREGHLEVARKLLGCGAEADPRNYHRSTPLLLASQYGYTDIVQLLLDHNADVYAFDLDNDTPLHCAAAYGHLEIVRLLLERNPMINFPNSDGLTPLHRASRSGNPDVVKLLLDYCVVHADVQVRNLSRKIAPGLASDVAFGPKQQEIIQLLSQHAAERINETE